MAHWKPDRAGEGQFADHCEVVELVGLDLLVGRERGDGNGQVEARASDGELERAELAEENAAARLQARRDLAVGGRHVVAKEVRVAGRADARRVIDVLQRVGNAVHRAAVLPALQLPVGPLRVLKSALACDEHEGTER